MVQGLQTGQAAIQGQSEITLGQLYDYVHDKVIDANSNMTPQRWVEAQKDSIIIAQNPNPAVAETSIPEDLHSDLENARPHIREGAVRELGRLADSGDQAMVDLVIKVLNERLRVERDIYVCKAIEGVLAQSTAVVNEKIETASIETGSGINEPIKPNVKRTKYLYVGIILALVVLAIFYKREISSLDFNLPIKTPMPAIVNNSKLEKVIEDTLVVKTKPIKENVSNSGKVVKDIPSVITKPIRTPGTVFQDTLKDGSKGPEMVVIPKGQFRMGDQNSSFDDEKPVHDITIIKPFALGKYPVTFAEYDYFCEKNGEEKPKDEGWGRNKRPLIYVSWKQGVAYAKWLSAETGKDYRLASEAEWEYAARAGAETDYWWGNEPSQEYANFGNEKTSPVGKYKPNNFGLHDMSGNVWEWVEDCYHGSYKDKPMKDGSAWVSGSCEIRVLRGGSWFDIPRDGRSAYRVGVNPQYRYSSVGFRLAQDL
jgi:formylglycine-generating enzyme required for sulfatase activity